MVDPTTLSILSDVLKSGGGTASTFIIFGAGFLVYKKYFVNGKEGKGGKVRVEQDQAYDDHIKLLVSESVTKVNNGFREELKDSSREIKEEMKEDKKDILAMMSENKGALDKSIQAVHRRIDEHLNKR